MGNAQKGQPHDQKIVKLDCLGETVILTKAGQQIMLLKLMLSSQTDLQLWQKRRVSVSDHEQLLLPLHFQSQKKGFCSQQVQVQLEYPVYMYTLSSELKSRMLQEHIFKESQIFYILFVLLDVAKLFEKTNQRAGDIRPQNIIINDHGHIKLVGTDSYPGFKNSYQRATLSLSSFISPQDLQAVKQKKIVPPGNSSVGEAFAIGLTILQLMSLQQCQQLFITKEHYFNYERMHVLVQSVERSGHYSKQLMKIMRSLLLPERQRPSCGQIFSILLPYENNIMDQQPFAIQEDKALRGILEYRNNIAILDHFRSYNDRERKSAFQQAPVVQTPPFVNRTSFEPLVQESSLKKMMTSANSVTVSNTLVPLKSLRVGQRGVTYDHK